MEKGKFKKAIKNYRELAANEIEVEKCVGDTLTGPRPGIEGKLELSHIINPKRPVFASISCSDEKYASTFRMGHFNTPEILSKSVRGANYVGGMEFGSNLIKQKLVTDFDDLVSFLLDYKFGILDIVDEEEINGNTVLDLRVYECIECACLPNIGKPTCIFEAGMITGILTEMTKKDVSAKEVRCWTNGYSFCQFEVTLE
ncbi:MAG: hydrocarbon-binding protein [Methanobacterium sp. ERen5]|nr:MAG: hydrocarbon-binding protein [Methanobacterium sp. ERen5]